ncbi:MAG: Rab family GTPase [Chloroflexota bacterium]
MLPIQKKVCLLGDFAVGKTSLVRRFVEGVFEDKYLSTIGTKVSRKSLTLNHNNASVDMQMMLWDLAGGEKFDQVMSSYYRGAGAALLVCDLTRPETLDIVHRYIRDFWEINPGTPLILVGNKIDLVDMRLISDESLNQVGNQYQMKVLTSSAKTGENVEMAFQMLGTQILEKQ